MAYFTSRPSLRNVPGCNKKVIFYYLFEPKKRQVAAPDIMPARLAPRGGGGGDAALARPDEERTTSQLKTNEKREGDTRPAELDNKEAMALRSQAAEAVLAQAAEAVAQAAASKRVHRRLYGIIAGLVLMLAVSMAGTFASSIVAIESSKDTVISADGAFVDKKTGALVSTENPHFTTKAAGQVQALEGLISSGATTLEALLRGSQESPHYPWH